MKEKLLQYLQVLHGRVDKIIKDMDSRNEKMYLQLRAEEQTISRIIVDLEEVVNLSANKSMPISIPLEYKGSMRDKNNG